MSASLRWATAAASAAASPSPPPFSAAPFRAAAASCLIRRLHGAGCVMDHRRRCCYPLKLSKPSSRRRASVAAAEQIQSDIFLRGKAVIAASSGTARVWEFKVLPDHDRNGVADVGARCATASPQEAKRVDMSNSSQLALRCQKRGRRWALV